MRKNIFLSFLITIFLFGCVMGQNLTEEEIAQFGTKSFSGSKSKVFKASVDALKMMGYTIAVQNPEKGLIVTERMLVGQRADVRAYGYGTAAVATSSAGYRQYTLKVIPLGEGHTRVVAKPSVYINGVDVSNQPQWALEGDSGERTLWNQLFTKIYSNL